MDDMVHASLSRAMVALRSDLIAIARRYSRGTHEAEDLVHSAYQRALERTHTLRHDANLAAWLRRVVRNTCLDRCRTVRVGIPLSEMQTPAAPVTNPAPWQLLDDARLRALLDELPPSLAQTYGLHFFEQLSNAQIATRLQVPPATVGSRLHRARIWLRERLERTSGTEA